MVKGKGLDFIFLQERHSAKLCVSERQSFDNEAGHSFLQARGGRAPLTDMSFLAPFDARTGTIQQCGSCLF